ncbi:MAG: NFACT family protein [Ruminococcus sp.]|jgi:predicted ribosome quality control (RQC) complex YloA/Tae2 family protein|nr:NFACT family protein [Ruminococcus sp.]
MSLDGAFLKAIHHEISFLENGRIDRINQPSKEDLVFSFRAQGGNHKLLISTAPDAARVSLIENAPENPKTPPMFCMLLRKHLGGGKLLSIRQIGLERALFFDFEAMNELGDMVKITVAAEVMGKYSNVILTGGDGKVIDSLRRVDMNVSDRRLILPGVRYQMPPRDERKLSIFDFSKETLSERLKEEAGETSRALVKIFEGISPILARELVYQPGDLSDNISLFAKNLSNKKIKPTIIIDDKTLKDFAVIDVFQYEELYNKLSFEGDKAASDCLEYFYRERGNSSRLRQKAGDLQRVLTSSFERITGRIAAQKIELEKSSERFMQKTMGDLLSANLYRIPEGAKDFSCENFYDENLPVIKIPLDKRYSASKNMQNYYHEYKKGEIREKILTEQIKKGEDELIYIESVSDLLSRAKTDAEIEEIREELIRERYIKSVSNGKKISKKVLAPIKFVSPDGYEILVGRNNTQNDMITKNADKTDIWLHTKNIPGSHLIIKTSGKSFDEIPEETIFYAASLAASHSKARASAQVPVDVVEVRYVKKPAKSKPGMVIFTHNKTLFVKPAEDLS